MEKIPRLEGELLHGMLKLDYKIRPLLCVCLLKFSSIPHLLGVTASFLMGRD